METEDKIGHFLYCFSELFNFAVYLLETYWANGLWFGADGALCHALLFFYFMKKLFELRIILNIFGKPII